MKNKILWIVAALFALIGLGYFVFPADFINDIVPVIGMVDDLVVNSITLLGMIGSVIGAIYIMTRPNEAPVYDYSNEPYGDYYEEG